jgi:hypothetical protein
MPAAEVAPNSGSSRFSGCLSVFEMIRRRRHDAAVTLCTFDLLELDGEICGASQERSGKPPSTDCCTARDQVSRLSAISKSTARSSTNRPARSAVRVSCLRVVGRHTDQAVAIVGSKSRTQPRQPRSASKRKIGTSEAAEYSHQIDFVISLVAKGTSELR